MKKTCSKCSKEKNVSDFRKDKSKPDGVQTFCKECARSFHRSVYHERYGDKSRARMKARTTSNAALIYEYKSQRQCICCGETEPICLEFHHLDPSEKEFQIANNRGTSWEKLLTEIQKCIILCSNCHKKVHAGKINIPVD